MAPLTIESTNEELFLENHPLGELIIETNRDYGGGRLGVDYKDLRGIIAQIVLALNTQELKNQALQDTVQDLQEALNSCNSEICGYEGRIRDCEETCQTALVQSSAVQNTLNQQLEKERQQKEKDQENATAERLGLASLDALEAVVTRVDKVEVEARKERDKLLGQLALCEGDIKQIENQIETDLPQRFMEFRDTLLGFKEDNSALRDKIEETNQAKADQKIVDKLGNSFTELEGKQKDLANFLETMSVHTNLEKLDGLVTSMESNRTQIQNIWTVFRKEFQELRDWSASANDDMRRDIRSKAENDEVINRIEGILREVANLEQYSYAFMRLEEKLSTKAEAEDVDRMAEAIGRLTRNARKKGMLLLGAQKCISCDRPMEGNTGPTANTVDLDNERCREELIDRVDRALDQTGGQDEDMRFVAVKVGRAMQMRGVDGRYYNGREPMAETSIDNVSIVHSARGTTKDEAGPRTWTPSSGFSRGSPSRSMMSPGCRSPSPILQPEPPSSSRPQSRMRYSQASPVPSKPKVARGGMGPTISAALRSTSSTPFQSKEFGGSLMKDSTEDGDPFFQSKGSMSPPTMSIDSVSFHRNPQSPNLSTM